MFGKQTHARLRTGLRVHSERRCSEHSLMVVTITTIISLTFDLTLCFVRAPALRVHSEMKCSEHLLMVVTITTVISLTFDPTLCFLFPASLSRN